MAFIDFFSLIANIFVVTYRVLIFWTFWIFWFECQTVGNIPVSACVLKLVFSVDNLFLIAFLSCFVIYGALFRGGSRLQNRLRQRSLIKAPISFLNIHKLLWKSKILVHGHLRIFLNFVTFPLIVLIKIVQVIKNNFLGTGFVINNKLPLNKRTVKHD